MYFDFKNFCRILAEKQMTLTEVSRMSEIDLSAISKYSKGKKKPNFKSIGKLAKALEVDIDDLVFEEQI